MSDAHDLSVTAWKAWQARASAGRRKLNMTHSRALIGPVRYEKPTRAPNQRRGKDYAVVADAAMGLAQPKTCHTSAEPATPPSPATAASLRRR